MKSLIAALAVGAALAGSVFTYDWNKEAAASVGDSGGGCSNCSVSRPDSAVSTPDALLAGPMLAGLRRF
jgi:hypothetical protein